MNRTLFVTIAVVLAVAAGCSSSSKSPAAASGAARSPTVEYTGPKTLQARTAIGARTRAFRSRVVAVTFLLDGRPLGTDTTKPWRLDVDAALLAPGPHEIHVAAVDSLGRRASSSPTAVKVAASRRKVSGVTPNRFAAAARALRRGGVTVRLAPGRFSVRELRLGSGARLVGSGPETVIAPVRGAPYWALVVAKGTGIRISDLTIDGGGGPSTASPRDGGIAVAVFDGAQDVRLQRLRIRRVRTHGVNVWGAHRAISVQDSLIEGGGTADAGVVSLGSDRSRDTSVIRSTIRGFRSYGILLAQKEFGRRAAALHGLALDNHVADIRDPARDACITNPRRARGCGTNEGGIWTGGVEAAIIGNTVTRARWDGIETVGSSTRTTVVANKISKTRTGIYLEHSTNDSLIARNLIVDAETGINVEWFHDGAGSSRNTFSGNRIVGARESGLFVDVASDRNRIVRNVFVGGARPAITLQGSSGNVVKDNVGCKRAGPLVGFETARHDDGRVAHSRGNRLDGNRSAAAC